MPQRRSEARLLRRLARATLAFMAWLDGSAASADTDDQAQEARRQLQAAARSRQQLEPTYLYDSRGRITGIIDPPPPDAYSLRLGDAGELLVVTPSDVFTFVLDADDVLHFVARRPLASEADQPS